MPRAKKAPSEAKPREKQPQVMVNAGTAGAAVEVTHEPAPAVAASVAPKTTEKAGKPVSSVNPQGGTAGVKSNGRGDTDLEAAIRARAYEIWERRGRPQGAGHDDWLQAEREILSEREKRTA